MSRLNRAAGTKHGVKLLERGERVQLVQVQAVGVQLFERAIQLRPGVVAGALQRFAAEEEPVAVRRQPLTDAHLREAVLRRHVDVVDAARQRQVKRGGCPLLVDLPEGRGAEHDHRALVVRASQSSFLHDVLLQVKRTMLQLYRDFRRNADVMSGRPICAALTGGRAAGSRAAGGSSPRQ
ncbi:MAG: hypothetical protein M5R40_20175 [Anaerolineae bacterium]|nr:hypothetical protein [Anaerolineae bacterium]